MKQLFILSIIAVSLTVGTVARADELPGAPVACITVFPCDQLTGELLPQYNDESNPCYSYFKSQCDYEQIINVTGRELIKCEQSKSVTEKKEKKLKKRIRQLRRRLRSSR